LSFGSWTESQKAANKQKTPESKSVSGTPIFSPKIPASRLPNGTRPKKRQGIDTHDAAAFVLTQNLIELGQEAEGKDQREASCGGMPKFDA